jgi:hypothetical protein
LELLLKPLEQVAEAEEIQLVQRLELVEVVAAAEQKVVPQVLETKAEMAQLALYKEAVVAAWQKMPRKQDPLLMRVTDK